MQMFRKPVERAMQGDRVGICVTQLDSNLLERGIASAPNYVPTVSALILAVTPIRFFKGSVASKSKFHSETRAHTSLIAFSKQTNEREKK